jgi:phosphoribosylanthranilate isomerase
MTIERGLQIKICGMREGRNIAAIAELSPDYLGFIFVSDSPRYVGKEFKDVVGRSLTSNARLVGVFRDHSIDFIEECSRKMGLQVAQLHGFEDKSYTKALKSRLPEVEIWKGIGIQRREDISSLTDDYQGVSRFVLDNRAGGSGKPFEWEWLETYTARLPIVLAGGIGPENIESAIRVARRISLISTIDVNSRVEVEPGIKDIEKVRDVLQTVRNEP